MEKIGLLINGMINCYSGDARRINPFLKVYAAAKTTNDKL